MQTSVAGQFLREDFFENTGGINLTDSPFVISDAMATGGYNFDYIRTGGFQKSLCPSATSTTADAQLKTHGLALYNTQANEKDIIRAAGTKIQLTSLEGTYTNLTEDTTAVNSDFLTADSPVNSVMYTSPTFDVLWMTGAGMSVPYGVASSTKVTKNGVDVPTGTLYSTTSIGGGSFTTAGTYRYAVAFRKASTQAVSNVALEISQALANATDIITLDFSALSNIDSTKYDKIVVYRSAVSGSAAFTTGNIAALVSITSTSYVDTGTNYADAVNVPRAGNVLLDNSQLASGSYNTLALFKRRLVTSTGSTISFSDINKPESWPTVNTISVPSGGDIRGLAVISFTTPSATTTDEFLAIFKETETWIVTGDSYSDWSLKFIDNTGCIAQQLIVNANGYLYFIDNRGIYLWDGAGKPIYISRPIESIFKSDGTLDKAKLNVGFGRFFKRQNQVVWFLSDTIIGEQKYLLKLDLRLTLPSVSNTLGQRILDGKFTPGKCASPMYAGDVFVFPTSSSQEDVFITGDDAGYLYRQFYSTTGTGANDHSFTYETRFIDCGKPGVTKNFNKVVVWVDNVGNWDLLLDYWADYRLYESEKDTIPVTINSSTDGSTSLWDIAQWDVASWDAFAPRPKALVFNLGSAPRNNAQGDCIKLRFRNENSDQPVTINGFTLFYTELAMRK